MVHDGRIAGEADLNPAGIVDDPAGEGVLLRQVKNLGTETYPLHDPADVDMPADAAS